MGFPLIVALPVAIMWGLIIMGIDRWLVTSMPIDGPSASYSSPCPASCSPCCSAAFISTPIVLRIFQSEINNQISIIKETNEATFLTSQQHSPIQTRVTSGRARSTTCNRSSTRMAPRRLTRRPPGGHRAHHAAQPERKFEVTDYHAWQCQLYGGCGAPEGDGALAAASQARYDHDAAQITSLTQPDPVARGAVASHRRRVPGEQAPASEECAAERASSAGGGASRSELATHNFQVTNSATNGLLIRLQALSQLYYGNTTSAARFLLFLLFLVIECLPLTAKLLQRPGIYERIFMAVARRELNSAHQAVHEDRIFARPADDAGNYAASDGEYSGNYAESDGRYAGGYERRRAAGDPIDEAIDSIWQQDPMTTSTQRGDWLAAAQTEKMSRGEDGPAGANRYEDALRDRVTDLRGTGAFLPADPVNGQPNRHGGIEQHYDDDDL